jgi:hypothetical protein
MHKQWEEEPYRIKRSDDATITFTIALRGPHAWEIRLEDSRHYHSISYGWAADDPHDWERAIAPVLRQFFIEGEACHVRAGRSGDQDNPLVPALLNAGP